MGKEATPKVSTLPRAQDTLIDCRRTGSFVGWSTFPTGADMVLLGSQTEAAADARNAGKVVVQDGKVVH